MNRGGASVYLDVLMPASTGMFGAQARNVNPARWARLSSARMRPLLTLSARWVVSSCALVFSVALFGGLVRLMPWLFSRDVPVGVAVPFAELLVARGTEIAALVGVPMGIGIAAALFVERGEARALESLGAHPLRVTAGLLPLGLAVLVTAAVLARSTELETPRRFATMLVGSGRRACFENPGRRRVDVPLLSLTWLCFAGGPRLAGAVPGMRRTRWWFTARALGSPTRGEAILIDDLRMAGELPPARLSLRVADASVSGVAGWSRPGGLRGARRGLFTGAIALATGWSCAWAILRGALGQPIWAAAGSAAPALVAVAALRALDDGHAAAGTYAWILPLPAVVALLLHAVAARFLRWRIAGRKA